MNSTTTNTSINAIIEPINEDYEYIQYNEKLRLIHSIKDDMYQMQSIIKACNVNKRARDWFRNESTKEFLENAPARFYADEKLYEDRPNLPIELRGYYVHKFLVNHIAMWASPRYAWDIMELLDTYFEKQRNQLQTKVNEQKPRMVPNGKQKSYKYMIWKESINDKPEYIRLNLVRRNAKSFYEVSKIRNTNACWFYKPNLPIAMTPNEDIKNIIKKNFNGEEAVIKGCKIDIKIELLDKLKGLITNYFESYQE